MRIYFRHMALPKKAAKRVQTQFTPPEGLGEGIKLSLAQEITARMLGYADWHELQQVTAKGGHPPSPLDEDANPMEQQARIDYQAEVLGQFSPVIGPRLRQIALTLRVSSGMRSSDNFIEDAYRTSTLTHWLDPDADTDEWRYVPAIRAEEVSDDLWELRGIWETGHLTLGDYLAELEEIYQRQPENMSVITGMLTAVTHMGAMELLPEGRLEDIERQIGVAIPISFPAKKTTIIPWHSIGNRDFHRAVALLAESFYRVGDYKRAKHWFNFSKRTCDELRWYNAAFLMDVRQKKPLGNVHLLSDEEKDYVAYGHLKWFQETHLFAEPYQGG